MDDLGMPHPKIRNLTGSNPPKSRFLVCGLAAGVLDDKAWVCTFDQSRRNLGQTPRPPAP